MRCLKLRHLSFVMLAATLGQFSLCGVSSAGSPKSSVLHHAESVTTAPDVRLQKAPASLDGQSEEIDFSALNYYARQQEAAKYQQEADRLQRQHPGWTAPTMDQLLMVQKYQDESDLWRLLEQKNLIEIDRRVTGRQKRFASYRPSEKFTLAYQRAQMSLAFEQEVESQNWGQVVAFSQKTEAGFLFSCDRLKNRWSLAKAYVFLGEPKIAQARYQQILQQCSHFEARLSTLEIARSVLDDDAFEAVLSKFRASLSDDPAQKEHLDQRIAVLRLGETAKILGGEKDGNVSPQMVRFFEAMTRQNKNTDYARLLGWYYYRLKENSRAITWFQQALSWQEDGRSLSGLLLATYASAQVEQAAKIGWKYRQYSDVLQQYQKIIPDYLQKMSVLKKSVPMQEITFFAQLSHREQDAEIATALGWWFLTEKDIDEAQEWFKYALLWQENLLSAAQGLALIYAEGQNKQGLVRLLDRYPLDRKLLLQLVEKKISLGAEMREDMAHLDYDSCLKKGDLAADKGTLSDEDRRVWAWCFVENNRPSEAVLEFRKALMGDLSVAHYQDALYGLSLAMLKRGMSVRALEILSISAAKPEAFDEIRAEQYAQYAVYAMEKEQYSFVLLALAERADLAPPRRDLEILKGWSLYHLGRIEKAYSVFDQLDRLYSTEESRSGRSVTKAALFHE